MKKVYEKPMATIARFNVEEWLTDNPCSGCSGPINPGQTEKGHPENCPQSGNAN